MEKGRKEGKGVTHFFFSHTTTKGEVVQTHTERLLLFLFIYLLFVAANTQLVCVCGGREWAALPFFLFFFFFTQTHKTQCAFRRALATETEKKNKQKCEVRPSRGVEFGPSYA